MNRLRPLSLRALVSGAAVLALTLLLCQAASAGPVKRKPARAKPAAAALQQPIAAPGMVVAIDPETGRLVLPTAEQMLQLTPSEQTGLLRTSAGLSEVVLPNGAVMMDLQGRFMEYSVARLDPSGRLRLGCVNDPLPLRFWLSPGAPAPTPVLEEK